MIVHLLDGTYELFRHFYGIRRAKGADPPYGAVLRHPVRFRDQPLSTKLT